MKDKLTMLMILDGYGINENNNKNITTIKELDDNTLQMLESLLLEYIPLEETKGYEYFELQKENKEYLEKVKKGLELIKKHNEYVYIPNFKIKLNIPLFSFLLFLSSTTITLSILQLY